QETAPGGRLVRTIGSARAKVKIALQGHLEKYPSTAGVSRANQIQSCEANLMGETGDGADWIFRCGPAA
ncbi:MAG: hypothetical protein AAFW82_10625, partial [Pseudomonadota bacterium]